MIEINLLPGAGKKARGAGAGAAVGASLASAASKIKNPFTLIAAASVILSVLTIGLLTWQQQAKADALAAGEQKQVQDSTRYAAVLREKKKAETQRDSVMRQLNIIKTIDNNRFVWPHIMDEVSRALPQYTWLVSIKETTPPPAAAAPADAKDKDKKKNPRSRRSAAGDEVRDRWQHRRHPGADTLHETAGSVAVHSERPVEQFGAGPG